MRNLCIYLLCITAFDVYGLEKYDECIRNAQEPVAYLNSLYINKDVVVLCEREHPEFTQYEFICEYIRSDDFINNVGVVMLEVISCSRQKELDDLLLAESLTEDEVNRRIIEIYRHIGFHTYWPNNNAAYLLREVYSINQNLTSEKKIRVVGLDVPNDWYQIRSKQQYKALMASANFPKRDKVMADAAVEWLNTEKLRTKALIIMNFRHAYMNYSWMKDGSKPALNCGSYLKKVLKDRCTNVYLNSFTYSRLLGCPKKVQGGRWDKVFENNNNKPIAFAFEGTPFGCDKFDHFPYTKTDLVWSDVFDHMIFYCPIKDFKMVYGLNGMVDEAFSEELKRRFRILGVRYRQRKIESYNQLTEKKYKL